MTMKKSWEEIPFTQLPDMQRRIFTGENVMLVRNTIKPHSVLDSHSHPHEQILYVLGGQCTATLAGEAHYLKAGDMLLIPGGTEHQITATGDGELIALDIFSPIRKDFLE